MPDETDQMEQMWRNILETMTCLVCMDYVGAPVRQCSEGHLVCTECMRKVNVCPQCRSPFIKTRNRAIEGIAEIMLYPCINSALGCSEKYNKKGKENHEKDCRLRRVPCPFSKCTWSGSRPELSVHMTNKHHNTLLPSADSILKFQIGHRAFKVNLLFEYDEIFEVILCEKQGHLFGCVMVYGSTKTAEKFTYEISVQKRSGVNSFTYVGKTIPECSNDELWKNGYLDFATSTLQRCADNNSNVMIRVRICKERDGASSSTNGTNRRESLRNETPSSSNQSQQGAGIITSPIGTGRDKVRDRSREMSIIRDMEKLFRTAANGQVRAIRGGEYSEDLMIGGEQVEELLDQLVQSVEDTYEDLTKLGLGRPMWWYMSIFGVAEELWKAKAKERRVYAEFLAHELFEESDVDSLVYSGAMTLVSAVAEWAAVDLAVKFISNELKQLGIPLRPMGESERNAAYRRGILELLYKSHKLGGRQAVNKSLARLNQGTVETQRPTENALAQLKADARTLDFSVLVQEYELSSLVTNLSP